MRWPYYWVEYYVAIGRDNRDGVVGIQGGTGEVGGWLRGGGGKQSKLKDGRVGDVSEGNISRRPRRELLEDIPSGPPSRSHHERTGLRVPRLPGWVLFG